jgi:hypothetical protein
MSRDPALPSQPAVPSFIILELSDDEVKRPSKDSKEFSPIDQFKPLVEMIHVAMGKYISALVDFDKNVKQLIKLESDHAKAFIPPQFFPKVEPPQPASAPFPDGFILAEKKKLALALMLESIKLRKADCEKKKFALLEQQGLSILNDQISKIATDAPSVRQAISMVGKSTIVKEWKHRVTEARAVHEIKVAQQRQIEKERKQTKDKARAEAETRPAAILVQQLVAAEVAKQLKLVKQPKKAQEPLDAHNKRGPRQGRGRGRGRGNPANAAVTPFPKRKKGKDQAPRADNPKRGDQPKRGGPRGRGRGRGRPQH